MVWTSSPSQRLANSSPTVSTASVGQSVSPLLSHDRAVAHISGPIRLVGRRSHATWPAIMNDQPTSRPRIR